MLAVASEDHQHFRRPADRGEGVRSHRGELGRLALGDDDLAVAEQQRDPSTEHE